MQCEGLSLNRKHDDSVYLWKDLAIPSVKFGFKRLQPVFSSLVVLRDLTDFPSEHYKMPFNTLVLHLKHQRKHSAKEIFGLRQ